jgi:hypothetical protein
VVNALMAGALSMMTANRHLAERGWMSTSFRHHHCLGEFLLYVVACSGLLLYRDANLYPLSGSGLLLWMW